MKRKLILLLVAIIILAGLPVNAVAEQPIRLWMNGSYIADADPFIENGRTLVPVRVISESLGSHVEWEESKQSITISKSNMDEVSVTEDIDSLIYTQYMLLSVGDKSVLLPDTGFWTNVIKNGLRDDSYEPDINEILSNTVIKELDVAPQLNNNRTFVPIRFIAEEFGLNVDWDEINKTVIIGDGYIAPVEPIKEEVPTSSNTFQEATVTNVVDGDTIDVSFNGKTQRVRLILVNTPETVHPSEPVQFFGSEASKYTKDQLLNKTVYLEKDVSETDKYGRYLYYVWLARPKTNEPTQEEVGKYNFNSLLLENGYAQLATYPPDIKHVDFFRTRQTIARENNYGLWNDNNAAKFNQTVAASDTIQPLVGNVSANTGGGGNSNPVVTVYDNNPIAANYIGNRNTGVFHEPGCSSVRRMASKNMVNLNSRTKAINAGYRPCQRCHP